MSPLPELSQAEWQQAVDAGLDHRCADGTPAVLRWDPEKGTVLQRVRVAGGVPVAVSR